MTFEMDLIHQRKFDVVVGHLFLQAFLTGYASSFCCVQQLSMEIITLFQLKGKYRVPVEAGYRYYMIILAEIVIVRCCPGVVESGFQSGVDDLRVRWYRNETRCQSQEGCSFVRAER